jgi:hypothetical protein
VLSIWSAIDWTFENRASLSPAQAAAFYGPGNVPASFKSVVTGSTGSQVWSNGTLKAGFANQINAILGGTAGSPLCNGFGAALAEAGGVVGGSISNPVPGALQFASGSVVPGHGPNVTEQPVATFGNFTFYSPVYHPARRRRRPQ